MKRKEKYESEKRSEKKNTEAKRSDKKNIEANRKIRSEKKNVGCEKKRKDYREIFAKTDETEAKRVPFRIVSL